MNRQAFATLNAQARIGGRAVEVCRWPNPLTRVFG